MAEEKLLQPHLASPISPEAPTNSLGLPFTLSQEVPETPTQDGCC